ACLNFINLATARAISRSKEVGVRKTLGSVRGQIFWQFTTETGIIVLMATCLAFAISYAAVPYINELFNSRITLSLLSSFHIPIFLAVLVVMVTLLAGRSEEHTSELQSREKLVCRLLLEKKNII